MSIHQEGAFIMGQKKLNFSVLKGRFGVCRLESGSSLPTWALESGFYSVTRTPVELSVVCLEEKIPEGVKSENNWCILKVEGVLDFSLTGILASISGVLARQGISIFALSTFDTDYILVKEKDLPNAVQALREDGNRVDAGGEDRKQLWK